MKKYELLTVFKPSLDSEELDKAVEKITEEIKSYEGSVESIDKMGRKKLADDVQGYRDGYFANLIISVPAEAIVPEMGKNKVFVYRNGKAEPTDVTTGLRTDAEVQIINGLQPGDTILTSGTLQLRKGSAVKIEYIE